MRYRRVCIEAVAHSLPPHVVTSDEIERRLAPTYERLGLPEGRLELMTGIRERRFFDRGTKPGVVSAETANQVLDASGLDRRDLGLLLHGSVSRDQMEPATACGVHRAARLPASCPAIDVSNACLGLLSGMLFIADQIELGRIRAGLVVGTETARDLVESTLEWLAGDESVTRKDVKRAFASLTIGSGSAAILLCDESISRRKAKLLGGAVLTDTSHNGLCAGGLEAGRGDGRPLMDTDSEALLHAGVNLAAATWDAFLTNLGWSPREVQKVVTHQVGRQHRKLLLERLGVPETHDFPTVEFLGNTGAVALPTALSLATEKGHVASGETVALLGIGSGLSSTMLGLEWR
jgi:3-oxoacyl-[acyl-carrier-protein] synthase-3